MWDPYFLSVMISFYQVVMLDLKSIICAGYSCMLHLQAMAEEVETINHPASDFGSSQHFLSVFGLGDYSSPDLPCGQKDWREVENKAEVHQARPNCHCQVRNRLKLRPYF